MTIANTKTGPGIYHKMPRDLYDMIDALNPSRVKAVRKSLKHFHHGLNNPKTQTPAMLIGSAMHTAILEPDEFARRYVLWNGGHRRGGDWIAFRDANETYDILDADDYDACLAMRDAVMACPEAAALIAQCPHRESSLVWQDPWTGLLCKGRPDLFGGKILPDFKTTADVSERKFTRIGGDLAYIVSVGAYADGLEFNGHPIDAAQFIAVESKPPFDVVIYAIPEEVLRKGREEWRDSLKRIKLAMDTNCWPGVGEAGAVEFRPWSADDDSDEITIGGDPL